MISTAAGAAAPHTFQVNTVRQAVCPCQPGPAGTDQHVFLFHKKMVKGAAKFETKKKSTNRDGDQRSDFTVFGEDMFKGKTETFEATQIHCHSILKVFNLHSVHSYAVIFNQGSLKLITNN